MIFFIKLNDFFVGPHRYVGELISDAEADVREDDSYLFDLDNKVSRSSMKGCWRKSEVITKATDYHC